MDAFLQSLDQWALQVLMVIYHLLGVQDLPKQPDPHWQVIERWSPQVEGHYRLVLESTTIQEECRSGRAKYIVFPQTYLARQEIFADGIKVYTNEMDSEWYLGTVVDRPTVRCDLLKMFNRVRFVDESYLPFYSSINSWPFGVDKYPRSQFFYNLMYSVLSVSILFLTLFGSISLKMTYADSSPFYQFGIASFLLLFVHTPGFLFPMSIKLSHALFLVALFYAIYFLLKEDIKQKYMKNEMIIHFFVLFFSFMLFNLRNLTHTFILLVSLASMIVISLILFFSERKNFLTNFSLGVILTMGAHDFYQTQVSRSRSMGLAALSIALVNLIFYRLMSQALLSRKKILDYQKNIEVDRRVLDKTSQINSRMRQLIHDLKAPLTALNFSISSSSFNFKSIELSIRRINDLFLSQSQEDMGLDWYSLDLLIHLLKEFEGEERQNLKEIAFSASYSNKEQSSDIFFDPQQLRGFIFELIFNACKLNKERDIVFKIDLCFNNNYCVVRCTDTGSAVFDADLVKLGIKGYSKFGTGLGLSKIVDRLRAWGGEVNFEKKPDSFTVFLMFQKRNGDLT